MNCNNCGQQLGQRVIGNQLYWTCDNFRCSGYDMTVNITNALLSCFKCKKEVGKITGLNGNIDDFTCSECLKK
jgi:hypothetical protein